MALRAIERRKRSAENWAENRARGNLRRMLVVAAVAVLCLIVFDLRDLLNRPGGDRRAWRVRPPAE
jgi:hypothetical protein